MTTRHTPGPWHVSTDGDGWQTVMGSGKIVANVNHESFHCGVVDIVEMPADANASLIAAAPELLDALERIMNAHNSGNNGAYMGEAVVCESFARQANAAIAKAKGASSL